MKKLKSELTNKIVGYLDKKDHANASVLLMEFYLKIVSENIGELTEFIRLNSLFPKSKRENLFELEYFSSTSIGLFKKLKKPLWDYIPETILKQPRRIKDVSDYVADPEDPKLKSLISPFLLPGMGVNFTRDGIFATDKTIMLHLKKVKKGKKGVYCMTKKCFDKNNDEKSIKEKYYDVGGLFSVRLTGYNTVCTVETDRMILFASNTLDLKLAEDYNNPAILHFGKSAESINLRKFLTIMETAKRLGWKKVKIWFRERKSALVITNEDFTKTHFPHGEPKAHKDLMLLMPIAQEPKPGMPIIELEDGSIHNVLDDRKETDLKEAKETLEVLYRNSDQQTEKNEIKEAIDTLKILLKT